MLMSFERELLEKVQFQNIVNEIVRDSAELKAASGPIYKSDKRISFN